MSAVIKLFRPANCIMGVLGVLIGALVGVGLNIFNETYYFDILLGCLIAFIFMAAGNMLNDYFDAELDKINHPNRPIPAGMISAKQVYVSAGAFFIILLLLGSLINSLMFFILVLATFLMIGYELVFKSRGLVGNFTIGVLTGLLFLFGAAVVSEFGVALILFFFAILATLTREIIKDIEDIKGDIGRVTLPKSIGTSSASIVATAVIIIAVLLSPIPAIPQLMPFYEFQKLSLFYLLIIIPADILFVISIRYFRKNPKLAQNLLKGGMAVALVAFAVGSII